MRELRNHLLAETIDDLMQEAYELVLNDGLEIRPSKGPAKELFGVLLELENPRARVSRSQRREKIFSALGELLWYLSGSDDSTQISHYVRYYEDPGLSIDGHVTGAYGPRLMSFDGVNQIDRVIQTLRQKPDSRNALIQLFDHEDTDNAPCTLAIQFVVREGHLTVMTSMRSNDLYLGLPHDIFAFTMIQEIVARSLSVKVGRYFHSVGSLHLYEKHYRAAREYQDEGWHLNVDMPSMPAGDPWPAIRHLIRTEEEIRTASHVEIDSIDLPPEPYWRDLSLLLYAHKLILEKRLGDLVPIKEALDSPYFRTIIQDRIDMRTNGMSHNVN
ncbi:thymidylate synthase [Arthrobacter sp. D5-1]|uniref:thymidylate synthase n=1 Tax=Arthrobacter sp. D5-1 TaxID=1477518 RepID=UPI001A99CD07|nr:thymidylate synthase [Arthrobacter sp. D5-1]QSZ50247.1 hypothetical protein AYX22_18795 [Arthrobacter sp. D5-1]